MVFAGISVLLMFLLGAWFVRALTLIAVQIVVSTWWLNRYRYGLMEWVWRRATCGKLQPLRLDA